jgi:hypothetical protein
MDSIKWRILNEDRVEVSPEYREHAWKDLILTLARSSPQKSTYRTLLDKANFDTFDYHRPLIYEIGSENLLVNNEPLNKALNRPIVSAVSLTIKSVDIFLAFICFVLLTVVAAYVHRFADNNGDVGRGGNVDSGARTRDGSFVK